MMSECNYECSRCRRILLRALLLLPVAGMTMLQATGFATPPLLPMSLNGESYFSRQLDAMRWHYIGNIDASSDDFNFALENTFRSRLYLDEGSAQNIQDENDLQMSLRKWLSGEWALTGEVQSYTFTTTSLRQNMGHMGVIYNPYEEIELSILGGFMSDRRSDNLDQGWSGLFRARSKPYQAGNFTFHPTAKAHYSKISPREYSSLNFNTGSEFRLDDFLIQTDIALSSGRRESYQPSSFFNRQLPNIIESIQNDSTGLDMHIQLPVMDRIGLEIDLSALNNVRNVVSRPLEEDFDEAIYDTRTERQEIQLRTTADYEFNQNRVSMGINFGYINRGSRLINTEDFPEDQITRRNEVLRNSNFDQSRFELFTQNQFRLSDSHEMTLRAQSGILRYDTPETNQDDRDELNYQLMLINRHVFSPFFDLTLRTGGEATHYVYLSSTRSIENNWRRTIRLSPQIRWQPHQRIELRNSFLVRANYTVEDYQLEERPKNDQSSREYAIQSEIDINIANDWLLEVSGSRSELRIGRLHWDSFQETPTDTLITYDVETMIVWQTRRHRIGVGGRFYMRRDYLPQATITTEMTNEEGQEVPVSRAAPGLQITRQLGPSIDINLRFLSGNRLVISGWLQRQKTRRSLYTTYPEEMAEAFQREERQSRKSIYPNVEIRAIFDF